jgi:predicted RecB family endonuclease
VTAPRSSLDDVIDVYKADLDRSLIVRNLRRSIEERLEALMQLQEFAQELRTASAASRPDG